MGTGESIQQHQQPSGTEPEGGRRPTVGSVPDADTEVAVQGKRRRHTKEYKLKVLARVADLKKTEPKALGEYLRSEGLYYSNVNKWKDAQREGELSDHIKGSVAYVKETMSKDNANLRRKIASLEHKLEQAEMLIDLQKKVSHLIQASLQTKNPG